jgi:RNA polymerase sigma-70 factor (ECF subfamily)
MAKFPGVEIALPWRGMGGRMMAKRTRTDREIVAAVIAGDRAAFQEIVRRYMQNAYYIALGILHNHDDALDLSQDAFVRAFRRLKAFDLERPFFPWFYRLLKNLCLDHLRKRKRRNEIPLDEVRILRDEREDREMKAVLWKGIDELPFEQKEVILLRYFRQFSYQEIAETIGKPVGTVMSSLFYAKKRLKGILGKYLREDT